jgi:Right handed beta helix region/FlgD Ig-like domain
MPHRPYSFLYLLLVLLFAAPADATTRRVPSEFPTIQAGIDAAIVGDTVLVAPGTYTGTGNFNINFNGRDIVLISEDGPEATIIDAQGGPFPNDRRVFVLISGETQAARIEGFTITGGRSYQTGPGGGGILCSPASPTIARCIIRENWAGEEEPYKQSSSMACGFGGGIYISGAPTPMTIVDCVIAENGANCGTGGAVWIENSQEVNFERCVIVQSRSIGLTLRSGAFRFTNCTIAYTVGGIGYGFEAALNATVLLERSVVWGNCLGIWIGSGTSVQAVCSVIDTSTVDGPGAITYMGANIFADPRFCSPRWCAPLPLLGDLGDYRVTAVSPCLPENNACGVLIGALGSCVATSVPSSPGFPEDAIWASPNPFSTSTSLSLGSALDRDATLNVFDTAGRRVRELRMPRSAAPVIWDGSDENGQRVAAGTYLLRLEGRQSSAGRVTILR